MDAMPDRPWHGLEESAVAEALETEANHGLSSAEVAERERRFGQNALTAKKGQGPLVRFLLQFHAPLVYVLLVATAVTAALGEWIDSGVIFAVVLVNSVVGFVQEKKALDAIAALAERMASEAVVVRDGKRQRVPARTLVPGDVVLLESGDRVPADIRLVHAREVRIDESALTGESVASEKVSGALPEDTQLADRENMAYSSTFVAQGKARGVVVATGDQTEIGRINEMIATADQLATPLTKKIAQFSRILLVAILALATIAFAIGIARGNSGEDMFMASVALAVGAIPEGLPAAVTIILAIGVGRMARRSALIRRLPAVETLGSTTVICSDKTGTLTQNQMTVLRVATVDGGYEVSGSGYEPEGTISANDGAPDPEQSNALRECLRAGLLCNDARLERVEDGGGWKVQGDPTEAALLVVAEKAGLSPSDDDRVDTVPFESEHQYMATLHDQDGGGRVAYIKGSIERLLPRCKDALDARGERVAFDAEAVERTAEAMANDALRVLFLARVERPASEDRLERKDVERDLTFLGVQGMIDPPRQEAIDSVLACRNAGISVKMITGDHAATAAAIAARIGLTDDVAAQVVTGRELDGMADAELSRRLDRVAVFARVAPEHKLRIVRALQSAGHVVAMTGDGVNDGPALKQADIGVAMGRSGTDVAKESADMVLTNDDFASIAAAVEEGRGVFDNLWKFIVWTIPTNLGQGLVILTALAIGVALPIMPLQILWINMTTALFLGMTLAFEPKEKDVMTRAPRDPKQPLLSGDLIKRTLLVALIMLGGAFGLYELELARGATAEAARTVATNVFVTVQAFYLLSCRSLLQSVFAIGFFTNRAVLVGIAAMFLLQLGFTYLAPMNTVFGSAPIDLMAWLRVLGVGLLAFVVVGVEKSIRARSARSPREKSESDGPRPSVARHA
jgi:cation-transporting P-type ATPase F